MASPTPDEVFAALRATISAEPRQEGLVGIRRVGNEAVFLFRWAPQKRLFGVPVSLERTDRRLDWDQPASDLDEWLESVDLWLMEDVENGYSFRARRRLVGDYIELRTPSWPSDERFYLQLNDRIEDDWTLLDPTEGNVDAGTALAAQERGALLAWTFAYENNSSGRPVVGHSTVIRDDGDTARLVELVLVDEGVPATVAVELVRYATHAAAAAGFETVASDIDLFAWHPDLPAITGFTSGPEGLRVKTDFLTENPMLADRLLSSALAEPGQWGADRDRSGRYLPKSKVGRLLHRLRYGPSGSPPRFFVA